MGSVCACVWMWDLAALPGSCRDQNGSGQCPGHCTLPCPVLKQMGDPNQMQTDPPLEKPCETRGISGQISDLG